MDVLAHHALVALTEAGRKIAAEGSDSDALRSLAEAAAGATGADAVVIRVAEPGGAVRVRAVAARSEVAAAELEGSRFPTAELPADEVTELESAPPAVRGAAARLGAGAGALIPIWRGALPVGSIEVLRAGAPFGVEELALTRLAASQLGLALAARERTNGGGSAAGAEQALALAGDALVAGVESGGAGHRLARLAVAATGAGAAQLWRVQHDGARELLGAAGGPVDAADADEIDRALESPEAVRLGRSAGRTVATVRLGQPPLAILQLSFPPELDPSPAVVERLAAFGARAAQALRRGDRAAATEADLQRTQALLAVVGQAIEQLSLSHTLETAADRVSELLGADRVAVYLREGQRLYAAHERGVAGPHVAVAERLLELALGPSRVHGLLEVTDAAADLRLAGVRGAVVESGIEAVLAVPLLAGDELIGIVAVYLPFGHQSSEHETTLLTALATQLAVAVQNASLHEDVKRLAAERTRALDAEAARARQLAALHEITSSFATSLSLDATLDAVVRAAVDLLDVDAAVIRVPDPRGSTLVSGASHIAEPRLADALRPLLERPQSAEGLPGRRLFRLGRALILDPDSAARLGASYELLVPFLEQGSTAAVLPIATPSELLATLTLVCLDPGRRIGDEAIETALAVAGQAALAIDNARLYQQQKDFADTMQRSLLPAAPPEVEGLDLGAVYESSARVDVGGDLYDFLPLRDGRLAAVLGDVSGHGIEATADMALAKYVFRSLAREHPEPGDFLRRANAVVLDELGGSKFITMTYVAIDAGRGEVAVARAGHPPARLVAPDGSVAALAPRGLALGVEGDEDYEEVRAPLPTGAVACLYTDGILEARRGDDQYGEQRLDTVLAAGRQLSAQALAERIVTDCRSFARGELVDDCAVVVVKRR